ncbi:MAG: hypothetical protein R3F37_21280 [Candidatus Competibacteraceae bacterium]
MKTSDHLRSAVIGYLSIGVVIGLTQLGLNKVFAPPCNGIVKHTLWERDFSPDTHFLLRVGLNVAQWLPDLYFQLVKGDMATRDYLLGGFIANQPSFRGHTSIVVLITSWIRRVSKGARSSW